MSKKNFILPEKIHRRYVNPHIKQIRRSFWHVLLWKLGFYTYPKRKIDLPKNFSYPLNQSTLNKTKPCVTWIGHCSFLVQYKKIHFLTDPIWSRICSPISFIGPKRKHLPGIDKKDLPKIDFVLISHNHYDHLDKKTVVYLTKKNPDLIWIVPKGLKSWFQKRGIEKVFELFWSDSIEIFENIKIFAVPTQHFSGRGLFDSNKTLWNGYIVEFDQKKILYFAGDTGYNPIDFKSIGEQWKNIDLSLIPIGTYMPEKFMLTVHINPAQALQIHKDVNSKLSIAMHWKTFRLSDEPLNLPPYELYTAVKKENISPKEFVVVQPGTSLN